MKKKLEKIVMIGPVYPYRGGISHYTSALYHELKKEYDVLLISYKMQYPRFLFRKPQKDFSNEQDRIEEAQFLLNTANPFNIIKTALYIKKSNPDLVLLQWWHPYFAPCNILLLSILKCFKSLFICHNVFPHERFPLDKWLTKLTLKRGSAFITQSQMDTNDLLTILPTAHYVTAVHPTYEKFNYSNMSKEYARESLEIKQETKVLLFFGFVREYKGLKHLLKAMPLIKEKVSDAELWVVGEFGDDRDVYLELIKEYEIDLSVRIVDKYVPETEIEKYFSAADLLILPYESATQSGIVQIAYGFGKPVVATEVGGLPDVVIDGKTGYLVPVGNEEALSLAVECFFEENREKEFVENILAQKKRFSWERMQEHVENLWESM